MAELLRKIPENAEKCIKELHRTLKTGTSDSRKDWFMVGDYKKMPNEVGGMDTTLLEEVANKMKTLLTDTCLAAQDKYKAYLDYFRILDFDSYMGGGKTT